MNQKTSRTILISLLVVSALLGLSAIGISYYYSQIDDVTPTDTSAALQDANRCNEIYLEDIDGERLDLTLPLDPTEEIIIGAEYQAPVPGFEIFPYEYTDFRFTINDTVETVSPEYDIFSSADGEYTNYYPELSFSNFGTSDTITISIQALDDDDLVTNQVNNCDVEIINVVRNAEVEPVDEDSCITEGSNGSSGFGTEQSCCEGSVPISCDEPADDQLTCSTVNDCFTCVAPNPEDETDPNDGVCSSNENFCNSSSDCEEPITEEPPVEEPEEPPVNDEPETPDEPTSADLSDFSIVVSGTDTCVERVSPNNTSSYTITVTNNADSYQDITTIVSSPPLGFSYISGSAIINGTVDAVDQYTTINAVGSSQEIVWSTPGGWSIAPASSMTLQFSLTTGSTALTGETLVEAIVTPTNIAVNPATLRSEAPITIAQTCSVPTTGLFDSTLAKLAIGGMVILLSLGFYLTNTGDKIATSIASTETAKRLEIASIKKSNPRRHFEEKFKSKDRRKNK